MFNSIKILDCTLRDGGYYNNWDFSPLVIEHYLTAISQAQIDCVELGLRNFPKSGFLGAFAYTTENYLNNLELPIGPNYGVMVDAKTILSSDLSIKDAIDALFVPAIDSKLTFVRVAAHFIEVDDSEAIVNHLKSLGYIVGFNLMQAGGKPSELINKKAATISKWNAVDVLYFADSLGNMDSNEVNRIVKALKVNWDGEIGIHTHNNMAKALGNTLTAKASGVTWLDATITGMGRGAGNAQTECLLAELSSANLDYNPKPIYELVICDFEPMQKKYGWGSNLLYFLGAKNNVHPTYIQNLLSKDGIGDSELVGAIDYLSRLDGTTSYNGDVFNTAITFSHSKKPISGSNKLENKFKNQNILLLANGPSLLHYQKDIENYINLTKPVVIAINTLPEFNEAFIDYYCISHNSKLLSDLHSYSNLTKPIILPIHLFSENEMNVIQETNQLIDYGLNIKVNTFQVSNTFSTIPNELTTAYAFSIGKTSGAKTISLIGFDGYHANDQRQLEMIEMLNLFNLMPNKPLLQALTPTTYPIEQYSLFAPQ